MICQQLLNWPNFIGSNSLCEFHEASYIVTDLCRYDQIILEWFAPV